ncbi:MAG: hypothetical protein ACRD0W_06745 [Acidimicrobiales bacterium]
MKRTDAQLLLDGETGVPFGVNLGDAIVWPSCFTRSGTCLGVIGAAAGDARSCWTASCAV